MYLGIELYANSIIGISMGSFFKSKIMFNNSEHIQFRGEDSFDLNTVVLKDKRISASGRKCINTLSCLPAGLGILDIKPANPIFLIMKNHDKIQLLLETNLFKDFNLLKEKINLRLLSSNVISPLISLNSPIINIKTSENLILVDISQPINELTKRIS